MARLYANSGDKFNCLNCGKHLLTLSQDLYFFDEINEGIFDSTAGEYEYISNQPDKTIKCPDCLTSPSPNEVFANKDNWG